MENLRSIAPRRATLAGGILVLVVAAVLGLGAAGLAGAAGLNFQVNSTADAVDAQIGNGVCATSSGACTLRAAIQETNAQPGPDTIQLPAGTYALAIAPSGTNESAIGDLDITDSLVINGAGASSTIVDGGNPPAGAPPDVRGLDRLFEVLVDGGAVVFSGLTLSDGSAAEYGGAILNSSTATVTIVNSVVRGSTAGKTGGGIENHVSGAILIQNSTLTQNYAVEGGSALNNNLGGYVELSDSIVSANSAAVVGLDESLRGAGAIANNAEHDEVGTLVVTGSQISDNRAGGGRSGAGIWNKGLGSVTIEQTTFSKNVADADGGAIYSGPGQVSVADSTFSENSANNGAAISSGGSLTVLDGVFLKNMADDWGGGIHNFNLGGVTVQSSSFTENSALSGGGFANEGSGVVTVESSTFTKNRAVVSAILDSGDGGGMHSNSGGEVHITDVTFSANTARGGGGFSNGGGGIVVIEGSRFSANTADERGGGILVEGGEVRMVDIDVVGNISKSVEEGGGGISYAGDKSVSIGDSAAIERSRIRDNKTDGEGGGIDSRGDGPLAITTTSITGNTAAAGGAIHHVGDAPLLVTRSTLSGNLAEEAGGVLTDGDGEATVENTTVSGNRAGQLGGGFLVSSRLTIRNTTVAGNNAPSGGGLNNGGGPLLGDGFIFLANSIVANNPTGGNCVGVVTSLGGNLENTNSCQLIQAGDLPNTNPLLGPLVDNGGPTQTHALLNGSLAQDAAVCTELAPCPDLDQRGIPRPLFDSHDIGAYESELPPGGDPGPPPAGECPKFPNSFPADADSWVAQGSPSNNSGTDSSLKVKSQSGSNSRVLVRFPLPPLPEGCTTITSAVLRLHAASAKEGRVLSVQQVAGPWTESGVTWANQPVTTGPAATTPSGQGQLEWDVTSQLLGIHTEGNHGLLVRDAAENGPGDEQSFNSREKASDDPPELLLVYGDSTPETTIGAGPASPTRQTEATFTLSSDSADATFECSLDGAPFQACSSSHSVQDLAEGPHRLEARATRRVRAVDPTPASREWTVDVTAPAAAVDSGPAHPTNSTSAAFAFSGTDSLDAPAQLRFECSLDGGPFGQCTTPASHDLLAEGAHSFEVRAIDRAGNVGAAASHPWAIDLTPPAAAIDSGPADPTNSTSASFSLSANEAVSGFECSLGGAPFAACPNPAEYSELAAGLHGLEVRAIDLAGNVGAPVAYAWTVDLTAPESAVDSGPADPTNEISAVFEFSASDNLDSPSQLRLECRLDQPGGDWLACGSPKGYTLLGEGGHHFEVRAIDRAGNAGALAAYSWTIDLTPPESSVDSGPADPTNGTSASFEFSADEDATFECSLDGSTFGACSSPQDYIGLSEGLHGFEVRATDLAGNLGAPAGQGWRIDLTDPETTIDSGPDDPNNSATASIAFSADEEATFECALDGAPFAACASPADYEGLGEGAHRVEVRAIDRAGNVDRVPAHLSWTVDLTPPETSVVSGPVDPTNSTEASFEFSADEAGSTFECSLDEAPYTACSSPAAFQGLGEGAHAFDVRAIDRAGNPDLQPARFDWTIDVTAPTTSIDSGPADPTNSTSASFELSADEDVTFECSLDGSPFGACSSPYVGLGEGAHSFEVRAADRAGNVGAAAAYSWTIDLTPPSTAIDSGPDDPTNNTSASFVFSADEDSTFACSLDGAPFAACASEQSYHELGEGAHSLAVQATDRAGNVDGTPATHAWRVDLTPPETAIDSGPADPTNSTSASFELSADEAASFECSLDALPFTACAGPLSYAGLGEGAHALEVRAIDEAGNVDPDPARFTWRIDLTPPQTTIESGPADPTNSTSASFEFSADEDAAFECSLDGSPFGACSSTYLGLGEGAHRFEVRATDPAGNAGPVAAYEWTIDLTAPTTTIESGPADPTNSTSASFEFSADEDAAFACSLDGAPFGACSSTYTGLGEGAHSFEVRAADPAGNVGPAAAYAWTIDLTPPDTTILSGPADPTASTSATFTFSSGEEGASFECRLDDTLYLACSSPASYAALVEGGHTLDVRSIDRAGNVDPDPARFAWRIDLTPPQTTIDSAPADTTNSTSASFSFSAGEAATFACSLDGAPFAACASPKSYAGLAEGGHTFEVRATDGAENVGPAAAHAWTIDRTPPQTSIGSGPADPSGSTAASFSFSASESASTFACSLDGAPFASCSSPASYSGLAPGAHSFQVAATDQAGNADDSPAAYAWTIDLSRPETTIDSGPADPTNSTAASFVFSSSQPGSAFVCSLDGAPFASCTSPASYSGLTAGAHTFQVAATNPAGNADTSPAAHSWTIGLTAPQTSIDSGPADPTNATSASFSFSSSQAGSTFECRLDGGAFSACTSPKAYSGLTEGAHTLAVRATDPAGNADPTPAGYSWVVDTTAPQTTIGSGPADPTQVTSASFAFSSSEAGSSFACRLDGGAFVSCSSPQLYAGLGEGSHTFEVRATDQAGNADPTPAAHTWRIDRTAPETTIDSGPPATTSSTSATFTFSANEVPATFECSLDGAAFAACSSPRELTGLAVGAHEFRARAIDAAGNTDGTPASYSWTIELPPDTTLPETTITSAPPALSSSAAASFSFSSSKAGSTFECSLDGAAFTGCASPQQYSGLADGAHDFRVRARDAAGNLDPTPASHGWTIDTVAPQTSIGSAPPALTSSTSASFSFSASESGSTFECSLDAAAFAACSSPQQYTGLAAGSHQFRVRARDAAGNTDASPASHSWTIDTSAPQTTIGSAPPAVISSTSASFSFSASESGSTFECSLDGATFAACSSPQQYSGLAAGSHQFSVRARDAAGNTDATPATHSWTIDTTPPQTSIDSAPPSSTTSTSASFSFSASESGSTFECSLDGAAFAACTSPRQYTALAVGSHQFQVRARDAAGNLDASPASHSWTITAPAPGCSTPVTLAAQADAWIDENSPSTNKGGDSILKVQSKGPRDNFRALVRFPAPVVPLGCVVESATLRLYAASMKPDRTLQAFRLAAPWVENSVTWGNQPAVTGTAASVLSGFGYREWSVTSQVRASLSEGVNNGFLIRDAVEGADAEQQFHSREKGENMPQLVVRFTSANLSLAAFAPGKARIASLNKLSRSFDRALMKRVKDRL